MIEYIDGILLFIFLIIVYFCIQKYKNRNVENINLDKLAPIDTVNSAYIKFHNYPTKEIINEYEKEQKYGTVATIKYPNKYAEKVDDDGNITYNTLKYETGDKDVDTRTIYNSDFYKLNITNMDGKLNPDDTDNIGKTIKEVYDNSFIDFKKLAPKKDMIDAKPKTASSSLAYHDDDDWVYKDEKPENGGQILNNFYASDPTIHNTPAIF